MNPNKRIKLRTGDHLVTPRMGYTHHGLYIGDGTVIHYLQDGVCLATLKDFCDGATYHVKDTPRRYSRDKCVERAYSRIGEDDYNLLFNNCESFVNWCLNGLPISEQVTSFGDNVIKAVELTRPTKAPLSDCNYRTPPMSGPTVPKQGDIGDVLNILLGTDDIAKVAKKRKRGEFGVPRDTALRFTIESVMARTTKSTVSGNSTLGTDLIKGVTGGTMNNTMRGVVGAIETGEEILDVASKVASGVGGAIAHGVGRAAGGTATAIYDLFDLW